MNTTESTAQDQATNAPGCTGCGEGCQKVAGAEPHEETREDGLPAELVAFLGETIGKVIADSERASKAEIVPVSLEEARAYVRATSYKPKVLDVVRLSANGRIVSNLPDGIETAVVARVFERPLTSGKVRLHGRFGSEVVDCTLLMCVTEEDGTQAFVEMLFNSVFLELAQ